MDVDVRISVFLSTIICAPVANTRHGSAEKYFGRFGALIFLGISISAYNIASFRRSLEMENDMIDHVQEIFVGTQAVCSCKSSSFCCFLRGSLGCLYWVV